MPSSNRKSEGSEKSCLRIIGIDPGYDRLGVAIIEKTGAPKETLLYSTCFKTSSKDSIYTRLLSIGEEIGRTLDEHKPDALAIETLFIDNNQKTAMRVSEARGIIIYEALRRSIPIHEYSPVEIKSAVTSDGRSDKARMIKMVGILINMPKKPVVDDEYDAVAIALTHSSRCR